MKYKNKKFIFIILAIVLLVGGYGIVHKFRKSSQKTAVKQVENKVTEFPEKISIRYAFADVDFDKMIQDVDKKDNDDKADYVFVVFRGAIMPRKVNQNSILDIKSYKLDGMDLPKDASVFINKETGNTELIIKLPNKYLGGKNAGHTLEIDKNVNINNVTKIEGKTKISLPYSTRSTLSSIKNNSEDKKGKLNKKDNDTIDDNKNVSNVEAKSNRIMKNDLIEDTPKYSIELGKLIPYSTTILVKLDVKNPSEYDVFVDEQKLNIRKNKEGKLVFINTIKKDFSYSDVQDRLKIVKIKK